MPIYRNWRNPKEYTFCDELDLLGWAWEFLRRNEEYQRDWLAELKAYFKCPRITGDGYPAFFPSKERRYCLSNDQTIWINHPDFYFVPNHKKGRYIHKYGTFHFVNPNQDSPSYLPFSNHHYFEGKSAFGNTWHDEKTANKCFGSRYRQLDLAVDLAFPIDRQLERIKQILKKEQQELSELGSIEIMKIKHHKGLWKDYLRIVDAKSADMKISDTEIAATIYPKEDNTYPEFRVSDRVNKKHAAAKNLIKTGIKEIATIGLIASWTPPE